MTLPTAGPTSTGLVKAYLSLTDARDDAAIDSVVAAVNAKVRRWPIAEQSTLTDGQDPESATWSPDAVQGATMLAARLWRRKDSPAGVAAFNDLGPVYVQRNDPDVAMLLELGDYAPPAVG